MRILLVMLLVAVATPSARADEALRGRVLDLLSAYEEPASAADWRALGEGAGAELYAVAQDTSLSHTRRAGAVYALGFFPTEAHRAYLAALATTDGADSLLRRKAVYALGAGWGDRAVPDLARALAAPDSQLRAATARALGKVGTPTAQEALRARLATESDAMVRTTLTTVLGGR
ncbi:MAG: HEAT repeat domain-containing protein [Pseudomonadota bacterium]|nr:HEAT repeat domain-containing protein [Pseudomonadota bacterium]